MPLCHWTSETQVLAEFLEKAGWDVQVFGMGDKTVNLKVGFAALANNL
jgi:hypothetical protein